MGILDEKHISQAEYVARRKQLVTLHEELLTSQKELNLVSERDVRDRALSKMLKAVTLLIAHELPDYMRKAKEDAHG